ncbi:hypothetical protein MKK53_04515 [Methylobacterium sp. J-076]|nr:hypothetical protein [Methylobacterium sp. J-076]MCJ2011786.1 hypothetical protein [Methylobacterium sp. J-076]
MAFQALALAVSPMANADWPAAFDRTPRAVEPTPDAFADRPTAVACDPAIAPRPSARDVATVELGLHASSIAPTLLATGYSWLPFTASVELAVTRPAATFWIWRSEPGAPTDTTPTGEVPANPPNVVPPIVTDDTFVAAEVVA